MEVRRIQISKPHASHPIFVAVKIFDGAEALQICKHKKHITRHETAFTALQSKSIAGYRGVTAFSAWNKSAPNMRFKSLASLTQDGLKPAP